MNILITGGGGFIGTNLCKQLLERGHHVTAIDNFITSDEENSKPLLTNPNFQFIYHNITHPIRNLKFEIRNLKFIYHLACPTGVPNVVKLAEEMLLTCSIGTKNVLDLAKEHNAKLLFTSSSEVYGDPKVFPQKESYTGNVDADGIRSPYEEGKRFSESLVTMYARKYGLDTRIVRIFNTYGPHMSRNDSRVIPHWIKQLQAGKPITIYGDGSHKRTFCYVDDLVNGLLTAMEKGRSGEVYNLGSDEEITINDLAELLLETARHFEEARNERRINSQNVVIPSGAEESHTTEPLKYHSGMRSSTPVKQAASLRPAHYGRAIGSEDNKIAQARRDDIIYISNSIQDHQRRLPSLEKIKKLGWGTQIDLEEGIRRTLAWYGF